MPGTNLLSFIRSSPRNRAAGVSRSPRIQLGFSLNVADNSVWRKNCNHIRLFRGNTIVGMSVTRRASRRNIYVRPLNRLRPLTDYRLVISPGLTAQNGMKLREPVTIRFRTTGRRAVKPEE